MIYVQCTHIQSVIVRGFKLTSRIKICRYLRKVANTAQNHSDEYFWYDGESNWRQCCVCIVYLTYTVVKTYEQQTLVDACFVEVYRWLDDGLLMFKQPTNNLCVYLAHGLLFTSKSWLQTLKQKTQHSTFTSITSNHISILGCSWVYISKIKVGQNSHCQYQSMRVVELKFDLNSIGKIMAMKN